MFFLSLKFPIEQLMPIKSSHVPLMMITVIDGGCEKEDIKKEDILNIDKDCQGESVYTNKCGLKRENGEQRNKLE